ncbi:MAG: acyl transferase [Bacteroidetes bacterium CG23_combo_of_CG06-09_8_20_14_all_32_9]|nr:MAG: acyl transferase [Bacteroidetes bacterium CG23_combo_of_CG06-09_8_20_14_all_32_9]
MVNLDFLSISNNADFENIAFKTFWYQVKNNFVYKKYLELLKIKPESVNSISKIPFLPVEFFKSHKVTTFTEKAETVFTSSGSTGKETSKHYVHKLSVYRKSFIQSFQLFYGAPQEYCFFALLPLYLEREGSSLVYMVNELIKLSDCKDSGFFLNNISGLNQTLKKYYKSSQKVILLGVSFALLDFADALPQHLSDNFIVMETGGMKGRRKEITRTELHKTLCNKLGVTTIHSEYGMTELLSQAYSIGNGIYYCPPWMKIFIRDIYDPFSLAAKSTGGINVIDLANQYSCSFIETQDLGKFHNNSSFEVLGRFDNSQMRGCNMFIS